MSDKIKIYNISICQNLRASKISSFHVSIPTTILYPSMSCHWDPFACWHLTPCQIFLFWLRHFLYRTIFYSPSKCVLWLLTSSSYPCSFTVLSANNLWVVNCKPSKLESEREMAMPIDLALYIVNMVWIGLYEWISNCVITADQIACALRDGSSSPFNSRRPFLPIILVSV